MSNLDMNEKEIEKNAGTDAPGWSGEKTLKELPAKLAGKIAKRDFVIHQNKFHFEIKKGDDLTDIPARFYQNLKTEKVI